MYKYENRYSTMKLSSIFKINCLVTLLQLVKIASASESTSTAETQTTASTPPDTPLKTFQIYHAFQNNEFKPRGTIQLSTAGGGVEASFAEGEDGSETGSSSSLDEAAFVEMDAAVASGGFYKVKVLDVESGVSSIASVPACEVRRANFREEIGITLGNTGSIISISYKPLASPLALPCHELKPLSEASKERQFTFKTAVSHSTAKTGMTIPSVLPSTKPVPGYKWIKRLKNTSVGSDAGSTDGNGDAGADDGTGFDPEGKDVPENHSFLRKYWYVVLPMTIMTLMGPEEPDAGAGAKAAAPAVAAGASAATASGAGRKRRGKRG